MIRLLMMVSLALWPLAPAMAADRDGVAFQISDPRITESSGLVDTGSAMFTMNDSDNEPDLFQLDPETGATIGTIRYAEDVNDVEAIAPGRRRGVIWVGDIGDNLRLRTSIVVHRVEIDSGSTQEVELHYPDGAHDAEAMFVAPDGRIHVVTKGLLGGGVYAAAPDDDELRKVAEVGSMVTDVALMPDGRHLLVRDYARVHVYSFPGFDNLGWMRLPRQEQGEGISVSPEGRIRVSSEGTNQPVHDVSLSPDLVAAMSPQPTATPTPSPAAPAPAEEPGSEPAWPLWAWASLLLVPISLALAVAAARMRRGRNL